MWQVITGKYTVYINLVTLQLKNYLMPITEQCKHNKQHGGKANSEQWDALVKRWSRDRNVDWYSGEGL